MRRKISIKYSMMLYSTVMIIVVVSLLASIMIFYHNKSVWKEFNLRSESITNALSNDLQLPVMLEDEIRINSMLQEILELQDVVSISVFDKSKTLISDAGMASSSIDTKFLNTVVSDILIEHSESIDEMMETEPKLLKGVPENVGSVEIVFSTLKLRYELMEMLNFIIFFTVIIILLRILVDYIYVKRITTPLGKLVKGSEAVASGDLAHRIDVEGDDELGKLAFSFNSMVAHLKERDEKISTAQKRLEENFQELEKSHTRLDDAYKKLSISNIEIEEYKSVLEDKVKERTWELEESNRRLSDAYKKIKQVDLLKSEFLANMSHELRTPLNSIIGFSRVIMKGLDGPVTDVQKKDLSAIYNSGQHLLGLINDVLDLSKIEAGKMELLREKLDIQNLISGVIDTFDVLLKEKSLKIVLELDQDLPFLTVDKTRIRQVLLNVIGNAIKFTSQGVITVVAKKIKSRELEVIETKPFSYRPKRSVIKEDIDLILFSIKDTGIGIKYEDMLKVFETFQQIDSSSTRNEGGTGLGMPISHKIINMHGGEMWVESIFTQGSTFSFTLPVQEYILIDQDQYQEPAESLVSKSNYKGMVAVIDDDVKAINLYKKILVKEGYNVVGIHRPEKAVAEVVSLKPDFIILDVMMPQKDGWELIQELKSNVMTKYIPVVFCTILSDKKLGMSLGATEYLVKPVSDDDLLRALRLVDGNMKKIVVIDDSPKDAELIGRFLKSHGYRSVLAYGGKEGLNVIREQTPDLIIIDLLMPKIDGFCVVSELKKSSATRNIPIIVLSAKDVTAEERSKLSGNIEKLLKKGLFTEDDLMDNIIKTLEKVKR